MTLSRFHAVYIVNVYPARMSMRMSFVNLGQRENMINLGRDLAVWHTLLCRDLLPFVRDYKTWNKVSPCLRVEF